MAERFLYGDSEPFPETYDFLAALNRFVAASSRCLLLVHQAEELERGLGEQAQLNLRAIEALQTFFSGLVEVISERAVRSGAPEVVGPYANKLVEQVEAVGAEARATRDQDLDASQLQVTTEIRDKRAEMRKVLSGWLLADPLPVLEWALSLELAGTAPHGQGVFTHPGGIETAFALDALRDPNWQRQRKVGELVDGLTVQVGFKKAFLRSSLHPDLVTLDEFVLAGLEIGPDSAELRLRRKLDQPRDSFVIAIDPGPQGGPTAKITRLDTRSGEREPYTSSGEDVALLVELANAARRECSSLLDHKTRLLWAQLDGHDIFEHQLVPALFARIAERLTPLATEIERRSPSRAELSLKVEKADGRREEIYLRKSELEQLIEPLPAEYRPLFHGLALFGEEAALPLVSPKQPSMPPPGSSSPPPRASAPPPAESTPPGKPSEPPQADSTPPRKPSVPPPPKHRL